ncbi:MAG: hypothetical protein A3J93_05370 [Candidatus Magasanikbacteria bacterium RIFOXYC2_FULL_42_28]|uniref:PEP-utilising enzyme mobile domain-containing protein n=1 Tax=Candidatus Magasanikbacteria bacterium RIFOXYC2_FULL_42_28 TaxID=1798704 RepID=A0A1F6NVC4_9BACT|nr:MAG: hypothetical protein A3J93_05370 [Candidatus Magasanikbacteria bacterium RIFOXYC2_FULL_42_28]
MKKTKNNLPFDPNGRIFQWGPVPGKFFFCSMFTAVHYKHFRAKYKENWSETLWLFLNGRMFWVNDLNDIQAAGVKVFLKYLLPLKTHKKIYKEWQGYTAKLLKLHKNIDTADLTKLTDTQLKKMWVQYHNTYRDFWVTSSIPELANYGSEKYLKEKLQAIIKNENELMSAMEILTAPTRISFYQEEEIALSKTDNIKKHQQKYFWLKNSYAGTEILPTEFFAERKSKLNKNLETEAKEKIKETTAKKIAIQKKYFLSPEIMAIAQAISEGVGWQDERKKYIFMILHHENVMLEEVARRFKYSTEELYRAWYFEIEQIIAKKNLHAKLKKRKTGFGVRFFHTCKELNAQETENYWQTYETKVEKHITETKGAVASKGKTTKSQGVVHIVLDPNNIGSFKQGEVLVAPMTSPEYIFAMKLAGAVITDAGGLTSHAAIVSRELGIPCVVGAKGSTKVFKDGDAVEIDTVSGTVKLIK